jgi:very-short-patch-repair endonuclease
MRAPGKVTWLKKKMASDMRRHMSWPEKILWSNLRDSKLGVTFYTQKVILGYIADFWCPKASLVVETDGKQHLRKRAQEWDKKRDAAMAAYGIKTMRFTAKEVFANMPAVLAMIRNEVQKRSVCPARMQSGLASPATRKTAGMRETKSKPRR